MTHVPTKLSSEGSLLTSRNLHVAATPWQPRFLRWLWQERWLVLAWSGSVPAAIYWIYSGMPMICH